MARASDREIEEENRAVCTKTDAARCMVEGLAVLEFLPAWEGGGVLCIALTHLAAAKEAAAVAVAAQRRAEAAAVQLAADLASLQHFFYKPIYSTGLPFPFESHVHLPGSTVHSCGPTDHRAASQASAQCAVRCALCTAR